VKACCAIHNWLRKTDPKVYLMPGSVDEENIDTGEIIPGRWLEVTEM
jgi:3-isopropylmalate dehydratase small subunit